MSNSNFKCYFGCSGGVLHKFPSWEYSDTQKFRTWKAVLDSATQDRGDKYIYYSIRLCERHFEEFYISKCSGRLTNNAVPTLNLYRVDQKENVLPSTSTNEVQNVSIVAHQDLGQKDQDEDQDVIPLMVKKGEKTYVRGLKRPHSSEPTKLAQDVYNEPSSSHPKPAMPSEPTKLAQDVYNEPSSSHPKPAMPSEQSQQKVEKESTNQATANVKAQNKRKLKRCNKFDFDKRHQDQLKTVLKLKEKIEKLKKNIKSTKKEIQMAKKLSTSKSLLKLVSTFPDCIKTFTMMQCQFKKKPRGRRFSLEEKIMALTISKQGPKVYKLLQKMFVLPSRRSIQKLLSGFTIHPGINENIMKSIQEAVKKMPEEKKIVNLLFDEVSLAPGLIYNQKNDEITGFEDLGDKRLPTLADHALVLMIKGIKGKTKQPICFSFCKSATKKQDLKDLITNAIRELRKIGLKVICTVCDQSTTNVSVIKSLQEETRVKYLRQGKEYHSKAFEIDDIKVYPLFDTPHLLKGVRNNLLTKNVSFLQDGKIKKATWKHLELLLDIDEGEDEIRLVNKLTENHVKQEKIPKMKVKYAAQVFSQRVSAAMRFLARRNMLPAECEETADFLLIFDKLFDSFNGHSYQDQSKIYKKCLKNNSPHFKLWSDLLPILESMKFESVEKKNGVNVIKHASIPSIRNWIHNIKCFNEMWSDLKNNYEIKNLITRNFNQDPLENFFSSIRSNGVRNINPNCDQFVKAYKTLIVNNFNSPHSPGANCEEDQDSCFQSLQNLINESHESKPDFACEIDPLLIDTISEIKNNDSIVHVESKKYVTGYVIKKCKSKIFKSCMVCTNDFCRSNVDIDSFNYEIDYTKKSLFHPSDELNKLMNEMYSTITTCLRKFPQSNHLKSKISFYIDFACDFTLITCKKHKTDLINFIKNLSMNILINSWCNGVNRIINGKFLKFDETDSIKNQAHKYFIKHRQNKNKKRG